MPHHVSILYLFPGQGAQYVGMGHDLYAAYPAVKSLYDQACSVLGYDLAEISFIDPHQQLNLTRFTQPAILTHSIACWTAFNELTEHRLMPTMAAGHSLGEYTALVVAGVLSFPQALRLVARRGELMGTYGRGEMLAFALGSANVQPLADRYHCAISACNLPDQTVVGGLSDDLDALMHAAEDQFPRKKPTRLKTEGAFHTYLMIEAARHFRPILAEVEFQPTQVRVLSNYTGGYHAPDPHLIKARLFWQLFHPVQWFTNLQTALQDNVTFAMEFGGGIGAGSTPADKRPNLEGIFKKSLKVLDQSVQYMAVINQPTLQTAVQQLAHTV